MSFYYRYIFPRLLDLSMQHSLVRPYRERVIAQARGRVLEIGIGSGLNLPLYGSAVERICGIEPAAELRAMAAARARESGRQVELIDGSAERIELPDRSFDTVVSTWTLCSIADVGRALQEIRRVLKPDGQLLFVEHGLAPDAGVSRWQQRITPLWKRCAGGCHLDRDIRRLIEAAGLRLRSLETGYAQGPRVMTSMYSGQATPD